MKIIFKKRRKIENQLKKALVFDFNFFDFNFFDFNFFDFDFRL